MKNNRTRSITSWKSCAKADTIASFFKRICLASAHDVCSRRFEPHLPPIFDLDQASSRSTDPHLPPLTSIADTIDLPGLSRIMQRSMYVAVVDDDPSVRE